MVYVQVNKRRWDSGRDWATGIGISLFLSLLASLSCEKNREAAASAQLDIEPRRIILKTEGSKLYELDESFPQAYRDFRVDTAKAEWHVANDRLLIIL